MSTSIPAALGADTFARYASLLDAAGEATPRLIVDLDAVDHNLAQVLAALAGKALRLVEKSLPCARLLDYLMARSGSRRLMSFHLPFLQEDARQFPDAELMLGKPLPVAAAARFYEAVPAGFDPAQQLHWLIDTHARLAEYLALAEQRGLRLQLVLEVNVGLHRGGFSPGAALDHALGMIAAAAPRLQLTGLMGYDAHVGLLPRLLGRPQTHASQALACYQVVLDQVRQHPAWAHAPLIVNSGGSPSLAYHREEALSTELAVGSALLQPAGFDRPGLAHHRPALFIATPVLKTADPVRLPGPAALGRLLGGRRPGAFIYGGNWLAEPCWPPGLAPHALYGRSSNQELLTTPRGTSLKVGDWVFLRPLQSESVLLQFGDLIAVRGATLVGRWPVYRE